MPQQKRLSSFKLAELEQRSAVVTRLRLVLRDELAALQEQAGREQDLDLMRDALATAKLRGKIELARAVLDKLQSVDYADLDGG